MQSHQQRRGEILPQPVIRYSWCIPKSNSQRIKLVDPQPTGTTSRLSEMVLLFALQLLVAISTMSEHALVHATSAAAALPCTVCQDGVSKVNWPDKQLILPPSVTTLVPIPMDTCGKLDAIATAFLQEGTELCDAARLYGPVCGCPVPTGVCRLCTSTATGEAPVQERQSMPNPGRSLGLDVTAMLNNELDLGLPADLDMTCELYDAVLTNYTEHDSICGSSDAVRELCGCGPEQPTEEEGPTREESNGQEDLCLVCEVMTPNKEVKSWTGLASPTEPRTCQQVAQEVSTVLSAETSICQSAQEMIRIDCGCNETIANNTESQQEGDDLEKQEQEEVISNDDPGFVDNQCTLCPFGEPVPFPDREIEIKGLVLPKCGALDLVARTTVANNTAEDCGFYRLAAKYCGCQMGATACDICSGKPLTDPGVEYLWVHGGLGFTASTWIGADNDRTEVNKMSCSMLDSVLAYERTEGESVCLQFQLRGETCGCPNHTFPIIVWLSRISGLLSFLVSVSGFVSCFREGCDYL